jgi:hypothetical protein
MNLLISTRSYTNRIKAGCSVCVFYRDVAFTTLNLFMTHDVQDLLSRTR